HQISEIVPVKGVVLVGPLPAEIQNFTTYSAGVGAAATDAAAAKALVDHLAGPAAAPGLKAKGMERPGQRLEKRSSIDLRFLRPRNEFWNCGELDLKAARH